MSDPFRSVHTEILPTHTPGLFEHAVHAAASLLRAGQLAALPTETVYGLAANALNPGAVDAIFRIKHRPVNNPLIVHVASLDQAQDCALRWPDLATKLASAFWPGPLTMVLPKDTKIPNNVTAGGATVALRWPAHPLMQAVIRACGFPLAAPSANISGQVSPTSAIHVKKSLGGRIPLIVDGGQCQVGIESTVVDLTSDPPRLLRPGMLHEPALLAVTGSLILGFGDSEEIVKSPGMVHRHYAPAARLVVLSWTTEEELRSQLAKKLPAKKNFESVHVIAHTYIPSGAGFGRVTVIPHDVEAFARALYAELHTCDENGAQIIVVEALPGGREWQAIADRLNRAAAS